MSKYFTGTGDDGTTGLLGDQRIPKYHPRPAAYGTLDEASAALGLARSLSTSDRSRAVLVAVQRDLYEMMAEVAATSEIAERFRSIGPKHIDRLEAEIESIGEEVDMPKEFVVGGDTPSGAALDLARTIVRRSERAIAELADTTLDEDAESDRIDNPHILVYLNRLSSLCFVLALWENQHQDAGKPTKAKAGSD